MAMPATGRSIGTPAFISERLEPHTEAIDDEPFDSRMSETTRIVYGKSSTDGTTGTSARSASAPWPMSRRFGPPRRPRLPDREGREVVVVEVELLRLEAERVEPHLLARRAERDHRQRLRLAAREERRAVGARGDADLDRDRTDLLRGAPVGTLLVDGDPLADRLLLELVERELRGLALLGIVLTAERLEHLLLDALRGVLALELVLDLGGLVEGVAEALLDLAEHGLVDLRDLDDRLLLADLLAQLVLRLAQLLDLAVGDVERVEDLLLGDLLGARLDHQDRLLGARDHEVELRVEQRLLRRVDDEVALLVLAHAHGANRRRYGDVGDL